MKELYNKHKREIWVGVVVSLITTAVLKFGDWLVAIVPVIGISIFDTISNVLYTLAATHSDNLLLRIILFGSYSVLVGTLANSTFNGIKLYKSTLRLERRTKKYTAEELEKIDKEVMSEIYDEPEELRQDGLLELIKKGKKLGRSAIILAILIIFCYFLLTFFVTTPMSLYNKFEQDIVKITPYIDETEILKLKSDWVCMRSKSDYDRIYDVIDAVIQENALPK